MPETVPCPYCGVQVPIGEQCNASQARDCNNMAGTSAPTERQFEQSSFVHDEDDEE